VAVGVDQQVDAAATRPTAGCWTGTLTNEGAPLPR
jgi:hypothetical protein